MGDTTAEIRSRLAALRQQLDTVGGLADALVQNQATDVEEAHRIIRAEVEDLEGLTDGLFQLSCLHDALGSRAPSGGRLTSSCDQS